MRGLVLSCMLLSLVILPVSAETIPITGGTWVETFNGGGPGQPGNIISANITGSSGWTIFLPQAVLTSFNGGSGTVGDPYDTDYTVSGPPPVEMTNGSKIMLFSSLTLNNQTVSTPAPQTFTITTTGTCDAGCYSLSLTITGQETATTSGGHSGLITGGTATLTLLKMFEGTWCETFGPGGPGSADGTLSASLAGSGWTIKLPNAIHQGVVSGSGTPGDPWVSHYAVDPANPATIQIGPKLHTFSSLTMVNKNASGVPLFEFTVSGFSDEGHGPLAITVDGTVDPTSVSSTGMCGSMCGDGSFTVTGPTVDMVSVHDVTQTSASLRGQVIDDGGAGCLYWFSYRAEGVADWQQTGTTFPSLSNQMIFGQLYGLQPDTTYQVRVHVKNSAGSSIGSYIASFTTDPILALKISSSAGGSVTNPGEGLFNFIEVSTIPIEANAISTCVFDGWTGSAVDNSKVDDPNAAAANITVDNQLTLKANFTTVLDTVFVDSNAPDDPNHNDTSQSDPNEDGSSEHPFDHIQEALEVAGEGVMVSVDDTMHLGPIGGGEQIGLLFVDSDALGDPGPNDPLVSDPAEDGSLEHPFDTIQEALAVAAPGTTIVVQPGLYVGAFDLE